MPTPVERFLQADEDEQRVIAKVMGEAGHIGDAIVEKRRENYAETLSAGDGDVLTKEEAEDLLKARENQFIAENGRDEDGELLLPEWFLRLEAQDLVIEMVHHKLMEEGLIP